MNRINELDPTSAQQLFLNCCGARCWAEEMTQGRPYASDQALFERAAQAWEKLSSDDWLEAFGAHPKIGDIESLKAKYSATKNLAESEQSGVTQASQQVLEELAAKNKEYEEKFGYIFIVCATGKTADEMLNILRSRIVNSPEKELKNAIEEQKKITRLRLEKLT
ncbi:MAG: 2-oxo-4-hydroxy-4-carboxy-5-ureidoimidazoline decarboxylase [Candidatus Obscuribacterales bacterium]|nr:2-oxo-4-hydroxy-4-carboxy-5-ureidoimidazoline decarboxylase [Candidatus Obscuribacterales bacterium]